MYACSSLRDTVLLAMDPNSKQSRKVAPAVIAQPREVHESLKNNMRKIATLMQAAGASPPLRGGAQRFRRYLSSSIVNISHT
jgi:hypothetical protein